MDDDRRLSLCRGVTKVMPQDCDALIELQRQRSETFRRIHRLYKHGFRPDWSVTGVEDAIWWMHPRDYPELILYPDGDLVASLERAILSPNSRDSKHCIFNESEADAAQFDQWLSSVPKPSWWRSGRFARERYIWMPTAILAFNGLMWVISIVGAKVALAVWHAITR